MAEGRLRIGELAAKAGVNVRTIRFYERIGLLPPPKRTPAGDRLYTEEDFRRLLFIRRAKAAGLQLDEIRRVIEIREQGEPPCDHVRRLIEEKLAWTRERLREIREMEAELLRLQAASYRVDVASGCYCGIIERAH